MYHSRSSRGEEDNGAHNKDYVLVHAPLLIKCGDELLMLLVDITFGELEQVSAYIAHVLFGVWYLLNINL